MATIDQLAKLPRYRIRVWLYWRTPKGVERWRASCGICLGRVVCHFGRTPAIAADRGREHLHRVHGWR